MRGAELGSNCIRPGFGICQPLNARAAAKAGVCAHKAPTGSSKYRLTAVDRDHLPGDELCRGGEKEHRRGDGFGAAGRAERS